MLFQVDKHREHLINYIIFLRITPFLPNWFINITSPVINVPLGVFFMGTFLGKIIRSIFTRFRRCSCKTRMFLKRWAHFKSPSSDCCFCRSGSSIICGNKCRDDVVQTNHSWRGGFLELSLRVGGFGCRLNPARLFSEETPAEAWVDFFSSTWFSSGMILILCLSLFSSFMHVQHALLSSYDGQSRTVSDRLAFHCFSATLMGWTFCHR